MAWLALAAGPWDCCCCKAASVKVDPVLGGTTAVVREYAPQDLELTLPYKSPTIGRLTFVDARDLQGPSVVCPSTAQLLFDPDADDPEPTKVQTDSEWGDEEGDRLLQRVYQEGSAEIVETVRPSFQVVATPVSTEACDELRPEFLGSWCNSASESEGLCGALLDVDASLGPAESSPRPRPVESAPNSAASAAADLATPQQDQEGVVVEGKLRKEPIAPVAVDPPSPPPPLLPAELEGLQGRWHDGAEGSLFHEITGEFIRFPDAAVAQIAIQGADRFSIESVHGTWSGHLEGAQLSWDNGNVWIHENSLNAFDGVWVHQGRPEVREFIRGNTVHGPDGTAIRILGRTRHLIFLVLAGRQHRCEHLGGKLRWDDGDVWLRVPLVESMNGRWRHRSGNYHVVANDLIYNPDGSQMRVVERTFDSFSVEHRGTVAKAQFRGDRISWQSGPPSGPASPGSTWRRVDDAAEDAGSGELEAIDQAVWIAEVRRASHDREQTLRETTSRE